MKKVISIVLIMMLVLVGCGSDTSDNAYDKEASNTDSATDTSSEKADTSADTKEEADSDTSADTEEADLDAEADTDTDTEEDAVVEDTREPITLKVMAPYGTPTLSLVKMFEEKPVIMDNVSIEYEAVQATDVLTASLINNEVDIAIVPTNLAAVMHSKDVGYQIAGSSVWGNFYLVSSEEIVSLQDLKGQTISLIGRNVTPDAVLRYVLTENGINPDEDVTLEYFSGASELATNYIGGQTNIGNIPQPVLTSVLMKRDDSAIVIDIQEEWKKVTGLDSYPQASIIVSVDLINEYPEVVEAFLAEYSASVDWLNENPGQAGVYYENLGIGLNATIVEKAIPGANLSYTPISEIKDAYNTYLNVLFSFNPQLTGGVEPSEDLYFEK